MDEVGESMKASLRDRLLPRTGRGDGGVDTFGEPEGTSI